MQLTGFGASNRTSKIMLVALECGVEMNLNSIESMADTKTPAFLAKNPMGKIPLLETKDGVICESNAIMRHVCRLGNPALLGADAFAQALVNQTMDQIANELEPAVGIMVYGGYGFLDIVSTTLKQA